VPDIERLFSECAGYRAIVQHFHRPKQTNIMKTMIILTLIAGAAAQITAPTMTCSISCTQETATEPIMVRTTF
jgi:hypothetical protein